MKLRNIIVAIGLIGLITAAPASASNIKVFVDNSEVTFTDQTPEIVDGRTLVPVRAVFEKAGASVEWDAETTTATEAPAENPLMTEELRTFIDAVKAEAPVYGDFLEKTSSIPVSMAIKQEIDMMGDGQITTTYMEIGMASLDSFYVSTDSLGAPMNIVITDGRYYMVSPDEKTALYMEMTDEEAAEMNNSMTASVKANFDSSAAKYETGEAEFKDATYYYEKITTDEMGEIEVYADPATKELKYLVSQGITMELVFITDEIDASKLEIPADYTLIDMAEMMG